jgi:F0F1-type ATP synthase delta subunit
MSIIPATLKVADPYARTFYNVSISVGRSFEITRDFQNLEVFFSQTPDLIKYLENPLISSAEKKRNSRENFNISSRQTYDEVFNYSCRT